MMFMNFGAIHNICHPKYTRYGLSGASFSVSVDGKTGGAAAGFARPQLARISGHLHPPVDSPQNDSPRKLLSPSCALTHKVCTA